MNLQETYDTASERSQLKMDAYVHRQFMIEVVGRGIFCTACGCRSQAMQPAEYSTHRPGCPLKEIQARVKKAGGWPDREGDDVVWQEEISERTRAEAFNKGEKNAFKEGAEYKDASERALFYWDCISNKPHKGPRFIDDAIATVLSELVESIKGDNSLSTRTGPAVVAHIAKALGIDLEEWTNPKATKPSTNV